MPLARRLKEVVDSRYDGKARRASLAADLNENAVGKILENRNHLPSLETLDKMATTFGWALGDVAYWALGREPPPLTEGSVLQAIDRLLEREGVRSADREFIRGVVERCIPVQVPNNASS